MTSQNATSSSDRYEAARKVLAEWDATSVPDELGRHNAGGFALNENVRIRGALRALIEPPATEESAEDLAYRLWGRADADLIVAARGHHPAVIGLLTNAVYAGIQAAWESWEPDDYAPIQCAKCGDDVDEPAEALPLDPEPWRAPISQTRNARQFHIGYWFDPRPGYSQNKEDYA